MITKFMIDETRLATREMYMMMHPAREPDCELREGDVIELEEGFFILNDDLNPMQIATIEQIQKARQSP
ncbi:hypothetical protein [Aliterella atlantica]|uniref:Uncharacterized protein n=1 Tax=Aliterella atlantica CENA595 TaxID=1618023 RepID=A0A0D8ZSP8_9CYAN|nr:hypothetical protein [Aliterella atlantica]KJH70241.1 hypothetical protein UH38_19010 [Aliterella atlantica CENA595]